MTEQTTPPAAPAPSTVAPLKKGLAVAALILGIVAILGSWIPILNIGSILVAIVGLVLGIIAIVQAVKGAAGGKIMAIVGSALSVLAIAFAIMVNAAAVAAVDEAIDEAIDEAGGTISASADPTEEATSEAEAENAVGTFENPAVVGDGIVWNISQGDDSWDITFDSVQIVPSWSGDGEVAVVTGTATPTAISEGATSSWVSFPLIGWMADGAAVDDTFESPDPDQFSDYRHTVDLEATVGTEMTFYSSTGLPEGVVPNLITVETLFGSDTIYISTGL